MTAAPDELPIEIDDALARVMHYSHRSPDSRSIVEQIAEGPCRVHKAHKPEPLRVVRHQIWPIGMGGPDDDENKLDICDTGHYNVHVIIGLIILGRSMPYGHQAEKKIAITGYSEWVRAGKPGHPVFQEFAA